MNNTDIPNLERIERIDLAYTYTKENLKHIYSQIDSLRSRVQTFLGFGGVLLRFIMELSDSQPSYKLTKILAYLTCFSAIALLGLALKSNSNVEITSYRSATENNTDIFLDDPPVQSKSKFIEHNKEISENYFTAAYKIKNLLNPAIICLIFSTFFFTLNGILVTLLGK
jgi:hypothetical protein